MLREQNAQAYIYIIINAISPLMQLDWVGTDYKTEESNNSKISVLFVSTNDNFFFLKSAENKGPLLT